jgi:ABC-2 type transport system permease protein
VRNAIRSEWIKLRTARSNVVLIILAAAVPVAFTILITATVRSSDVEQRDRFSLLLAGATVGYLLIGVLGVLIIGQEFRHTTIRVTFTAEPRRGRVMAAKAVVVTVTGVVVGIIATVFSYAIGNAIMTSRGQDVTLPGSTQARAIVGSVVLFALYSLVGLGVGAIIRATAGAITLVVVWPLIVESIIKGVLPKIGKWLPFNAGSQLTSTDPTINSSEAFTPRAGGLVFLIFALVLLAVGTALVSRRDA